MNRTIKKEKVMDILSDMMYIANTIYAGDMTLVGMIQSIRHKVDRLPVEYAISEKLQKSGNEIISWLYSCMDMLRNKNSRHRLQDGHDWFICPAEMADSLFIPAIERAADQLGQNMETCKMIEDQTDIYCSECNIRISDEIYFMFSKSNEDFKYCPGCGRRISEHRAEKQPDD